MDDRNEIRYILTMNFTVNIDHVSPQQNEIGQLAYGDGWSQLRESEKIWWLSRTTERLSLPDSLRHEIMAEINGNDQSKSKAMWWRDGF